MNTMRYPESSHSRARNCFRKLFPTLLLLGGALSGAAQSISQSFPLRAGWNSIWLEVDPTNNLLPSDKHLVLAWGRDFEDVSPVKGVILGGEQHTIHVAVDVCEINEGDDVVI